MKVFQSAEIVGNRAAIGNVLANRTAGTAMAPGAA